MAKRGRKVKIRKVQTYLNPEHGLEAAICAFVAGSLSMRSSQAVKSMLFLAWQHMQPMDRAAFEAQFTSHTFATFDRIRREHINAGQAADSLSQIPPTPKVK